MGADASWQRGTVDGHNGKNKLVVADETGGWGKQRRERLEETAGLLVSKPPNFNNKDVISLRFQQQSYGAIRCAVEWPDTEGRSGLREQTDDFFKR